MAELVDSRSLRGEILDEPSESDRNRVRIQSRCDVFEVSVARVHS